MAVYVKRVLAILSVFIIVDIILILIVNTTRYLPGIGVIAGGDQFLITLVLGAAGAIAAVIAVVMWKLKS
ncbi:MAG: hypothetical protein ACXAEF_07235 [Candidatus Thorarchaeota archaeon]|jgi:hypothetical protein